MTVEWIITIFYFANVSWSKFATLIQWLCVAFGAVNVCCSLFFVIVVCMWKLLSQHSKFQKVLNSTARSKMSAMQKTHFTTWTVNGFVDVRSRSNLPKETARHLTRWRPRSAVPLAASLAMTMSGIAAGDDPGAAATSGADLGARPTNAAPGGQRVLENPGRTVDTGGAEATKMTSTEVLPESTTEHTMNQHHAAAPHPVPPHPPDPGPKVKRANPGLTAQLKTSTQPLAPRNSLWDALHPAPTLDPCLGHALGPDPGLDASPVVTDSLVFQCLWVCFSSTITAVLRSIFEFDYHHILERSVAKGKSSSNSSEVFFLMLCGNRFCS